MKKTLDTLILKIFARVQAKLMGSYHLGRAINNRLLYNEKIGKFQFIPNDVTQQAVEIDLDKEINPLAERILKNKDYKDKERINKKRARFYRRDNTEK